MDDENKSDKWKLSRNIPIALVAAMVFQTMTFFYFVGSNFERIAEHDRKFQKIDVYIAEHTKMSEHLASLDAKMSVLIDFIKAEQARK